jgi:photosystem II stability/assembly factor-like uncharacterized protein
MMGRVDDIEGSPTDPMLIYAGFATGGLWKSTDGGYHWKSLWDNMPNESIGSIGISASDPNIVYVGTGEGNNRQSSSIGNGVWGTKDGGKTWEHMGLEQTQSIQRVEVDPTNPNIAFVAANGHLFGPNPERGLYKTTDGGKTWKKAKYIDENTGFTDVRIDPKNPKTIYASSYSHRRTWWGYNGGGPNSGLWKSTDGGDNWTRITGNGWPAPKDGIYGRIAISIYKSDPRIVYAQVEAGASGGTGGGTGADGGPSRGRGGNGGGGETPAGGEAAPAGGGTAGAQGAANAGRGGGGGGGEGGNGCTMVPGANNAFAGGGGGGGGRGNQPPAPPNPNGNGVFRSEDGGKTWKQMDGCNDRPMYFSQIRVDPKNDQKIFTGGNPGRVSMDGGKTWRAMTGSHTDYHAIWINPVDPRIVFIGHDGGIDSSNDGAETWLYHNDIAAGQFYQVSADMRRPYYVCGGLQDNNAWCGPSALRSNTGPVNTDWYTIAGGDGFYTRQDPTDWAIAYGESQDGAMSRHDLRNGTQKSIRPSTGRGGTPGTIPSAEPATTTNAGTVAPAGGAEGGAQGGGNAAGGGAGFGGGGGRGGAPNIVNVPQNVEPLRFYWNAPFEISPHNPAVIYMAAQYFFKSTNRGDTWTMNGKDLTKNVYRWAPEQAIMGVAGDKPMASKHDGYAASSLATQIRESPSRPGVIWIGTDDGNLQVSTNDGQEFANVIGNIPGAPKGYVQISRIEPSHFDPNTCYVALDNHRNDDWKPYLFKTSDMGRTWTNVTGNLPSDGNINALREDYDNPNLLFVGTEYGLFVSLDGGREWKKFMQGMPNVRVDDILIHPRDRDLIIATHGRSIWILDDITPLEQFKPNTTSADITLFDPRAATQWKNDPQAQRHVKNVEFEGRNPQGGTAITVLAKSDLGQAHIDFLQGNTVESTMQVDIKAGMNRFQWPMNAIPNGNAAANGGGRNGGGGGRNGGGGRRGGGNAAGAGADASANPPAAGAPAAAANPDAQQFGGGGGGGRGGRGGNGVPFVSGGRGGGGGGGGSVQPGSYMVRLTIGDKTYNTSVDVLEDIWMRPQ